MDTNTKITIISAFVAIISAIVAYRSYKQNTKTYLISQTPILMPRFNKTGDKYQFFTVNTHISAVAKDVCILLRGAKLTRIYTKENEFLPPNMQTFEIGIDENIDGAHFEIKYENIFRKRVQVVGTVHEMTSGRLDFQNINFTIEGIN